VPIPISQTTTVTRTYVEYTSSPETGGIETQTKKFTKYLDDADLDFEKTFQQQSAIVTTITSQTVQSSSMDTKESTSSTTVTTTTKTTETTEKDSKDEKLWEKPLGECENF
jgi:Tfp pilus assembly major pilin PilA